MTNQQTRKEFLNLSAVAGFSFLLGSQNLLGQKASAETSSTEHPNVAIIKSYYEAYGKGDLVTVRQSFAPNIAWTIPGHHPLAGTKRGVDEVLAFFQQLAKAKFRAEVLFLGGNDSYVVDVHRGWSNMERDNIDQLWALLFKIEGDRIVEAVNFPGDQHAADAFFWKVYPLKPLPERLA
ncbi:MULTISPECIES: nuclear transport factor 2 family protein [Cyanophyceae]|uniref:nuclear transport factor 2 family protein n=1 Tax=Cyanophyceae TaxID=3028117 RepID=UPI0016856A89|nr:nuclear transport factor 2 family protein [Trichocoleus sp. FACHB-40]MBD2005464.1 nuclear transport factor 2 family protein [Trichocoleus sp. FACHB-40]